MESRTYECMKCHKRQKAAFGVPTCSKCKMTMANVTGRPVYMFECTRCHSRKRSSFIGSLRCGCGMSMFKVN